MNKIDEYHKQRLMFYISDIEGLVTASFGVCLTHEEWIGEGWDTVVRGYADLTGIYFYRGADYNAGGDVEFVARVYASGVDEAMLMYVEDPDSYKPNVYVGVHRGVLGERWSPERCLGPVEDV
jgi:hypothetical protein